MSKKTRHLSGLPATVNLVRPNHLPSHKRVKTLVIGLWLGALGAGCFILWTIIPTLAAPGLSVQLANQQCPQVKLMTPVQHFGMWNALVERSTFDKFREHAVEWLSGAVRVRFVLHSSLVLKRT
ncbi:MAG TPA: hypothetical protein VHV10_09395 [Ktedonobacteraceae bacterium]|nr:hypothetical protein [Ktedonobacteraceae bacterium]